MSGPKCECGIFVAHSVHDVYKGLKALQHRGQDSAGIAVKNGEGIDLVRWQGLVENFSLGSIVDILGQGSLFVGHVRYSTSGDKSDKGLFGGAHPRFVGGKVVDNSDFHRPHLIVRGADAVMVHNGNVPDISEGEKVDTDVMLDFYFKEGIESLVEEFPAAYSLAVLDSNSDHLSLARDRYGIRPLFIGEKDGNIVASSEDVAIWDIGGKPRREVEGGEVISIYPSGQDFESTRVLSYNPKTCFFEFNYLQSPSSSLEGLSVLFARHRLGEQLAREFSPDADIATFIPNSPEHIARGYCDFRGIPLKKIFYKIKKERSFLGSNELERRISIGNNLFVLDNVDLSGKKIIVFDDSLVRGNVSKDAVSKLRDAGASWIALCLGTPLLGPVVESIQRGCLFGVDMPPSDNFALKRYGSLEGIKENLEVDELYFISTEGLETSLERPLDKMCTYCIGGPNPLEY